MTKIIGIHSFRRSTGKTFFTGNLGWLLAQQGWRVAVVDTDFQTPDLHSILGFPLSKISFTLNHFINGTTSLEKVMYEVVSKTFGAIGELYLIPASSDYADITKILRQGYPVEKLAWAFQQMNENYALDAILIDTSAGLTEESLRSLALADTVAIVMLPDQQHYQGTAVMTDLAYTLQVPSIFLVVNQVPDVYDLAQVQREIEAKYQTPVLAVLPFVEACNACGDDVFVMKYPSHPLTVSLMQIVLGLIK